MEMGFEDSLRTAEDREGWKSIVATSSVVPRRPTRLRDSDEIAQIKVSNSPITNDTKKILPQRPPFFNFCIT